MTEKLRFLETTKKGWVKITKDQLINMLNEEYTKGYDMGYNEGYSMCVSVSQIPTSPTAIRTDKGPGDNYCE